VSTGTGRDAGWVVPTARGPRHDADPGVIGATFVDPRDRRWLATIPVGTTGDFAAAEASASPDGGRVAVAGPQSVAIVDVHARRPVATLPSLASVDTSTSDLAGLGRVAACAWSRDGATLYASTGNGTDTAHDGLVRFSTASWRPAGPPVVLGAPVTAMDVAPDGRLRAAGLASGQVVLLDTARDEIVERLNASGPVRDLAFSPDSRRLAAVGASRRTDVWDLATRRPAVAVSPRFPGAGTSLQWLPDGETVAYGSDDGRVVLYEVANAAVRAVPLPAFADAATGEVHIAPVTAGRLDLFSGYRPAGEPKDGSRYSLDPADWLARACAVAGRDLTATEWATYLPGHAYRRTCTDLGGRPG
jgi:WD40 repeat protein